MAFEPVNAGEFRVEGWVCKYSYFYYNYYQYYFEIKLTRAFR